MADPLLAVEGVVKEYGERVKTRALDGVDLALERGEFVALIGPSGSGKSTLLNLIGLLDRPTSGRVVLGGTDTTGLDDDALTALRARMLGFVFQFHHLLPAFTAVENVMLPEWGDEGFATRELRDRAETLLRAVGLADRMQLPHDRPVRRPAAARRHRARARQAARRSSSPTSRPATSTPPPPTRSSS